MKILKTLMEQKGMEIPVQPVVYVLCEENGSYSEYSMTVLRVFVDEKEAHAAAEALNDYNIRFLDYERDNRHKLDNTLMTADGKPDYDARQKRYNEMRGEFIALNPPLYGITMGCGDDDRAFLVEAVEAQ